MSNRDGKLEEFFKSLLKKNSHLFVEKVGLQDTVLNITNISDTIDLNIKDLFIFTSEGIQISHVQFNKFIGNIIDSEKSKVLHSLTSRNGKNDNFLFQKIYLYNFKIFFLCKSQIVLCSVFIDNTKSYLIKLYLMHMYITFVNFNGHLIELLKNKNKLECIVEGVNGNTPDENKKRVLDFSRLEYFQIKLFEVYFIKALTNHFDKVSRLLLKKEEMYLTGIKFKNLYLLEVPTSELLFDLMALRKTKKNKKYYKNDRLWQEIIYHASCLMGSYRNELGYQFDSNELNFKFVKLECTSTFPRLTFIIKFVPILKGIAIIHIYSQNKLSRNQDNNSENHINIMNKNYKEFDILYGNEIKHNPNIEFRYQEPKKLLEIEKFFIEFFISIRQNLDIFFDPSRELKYFDYSLISIIEEILSKNHKRYSIDQITYRINLKLYENFQKLPQKAETNYYSSNTTTNPNSTPNLQFLILNKEQYLRDFFKNADNGDIVNKLENSFYTRKDNTLMLTRIEDQKLGKAEEKNSDQSALFECSLDIIARSSAKNSRKEDRNDFKLPQFQDQTLDMIMNDLEVKDKELNIWKAPKQTITSDGDKHELNKLLTAKFVSIQNQFSVKSKPGSEKERDKEKHYSKAQTLRPKISFAAAVNFKHAESNTRVIPEMSDIVEKPDNFANSYIEKKDVIINTEAHQNTKEYDGLLDEPNDGLKQLLVMGDRKPELKPANQGKI